MFVGTPSLLLLYRKAFLLEESIALLMSHEERKKGEEEEADCSNIAWSPINAVTVTFVVRKPCCEGLSISYLF